MSTLSPGSPIATGRTAEVYAWQDEQVLKLFYAWCSPAAVQHEIDNSRMIAMLNLPTPRLIDVVDIDGRRGIVYERVRGVSMLGLINAKPWLLFRLARQLAELHTQIHAQAGPGLASVRPSLRATIQQAGSLPPDLKTNVLRLLEELSDSNALCHGDFHPDQVLIAASGPVILDWLTAQQGPPLADVARTSILLQFGQVPYADRVMRAIIALWRGLFHRTYLARYLELHPGVTRSEVRAWMIPVAAGRLSEAIPGEQEPLLNLIQSYPALPQKEAHVTGDRHDKLV